MTFSNLRGLSLVEAMIATIQENAVLLSDIDGAIGDGDHGINMKKGFSQCAQKLAGRDCDLTEGLTTLSSILLEEIGGAMGPLYGSFFGEMARATEGKSDIDAATFATMLRQAKEIVQELGGAQVGDKTMVDTLAPALQAFEASLAQGLSFIVALENLSRAAEKGKDYTRDLVSKVGRSSRLGERTRGILDAGAVSCWLLLKAMAEAAIRLMKP